jgi:excisionase family DNA binding protein
MDNQDELLTREQAAELLAVGIWTVRRFVEEGLLAEIRLSDRQRRYRRSDVQEFIERSRTVSS